MCEVRFEIPDASLAALNVPRDGVAAELRLLAAMKAFEIGLLSAGAAAELAAITKVELLHRLDDYSIEAFRASPDEFERDQNTLDSSLGG